MGRSMGAGDEEWFVEAPWLLVDWMGGADWWLRIITDEADLGAAETPRAFSTSGPSSGSSWASRNQVYDPLSYHA